MFEFDARTLVERLLDADLRGQSECGIRLLPRYLAAIGEGDIDPRGRVLIEHETAAIAVLDGSRAAGPVAATKGMEVAIAKAREVGTGTVVIHHSQHLGAAVGYAMLAAREGLIGFCTSNAGAATVAPHDHDHPLTGDHPVAWAFPSSDDPLGIDLCSAASSWDVIDWMKSREQPLEGGIARDEAGQETRDATAAHHLRPVGLDHGLGLGVSMALLSGALAGGRLPHQKSRSRFSDISEHFLMAVDASHFCDVDRFRTRISECIRMLEDSGSGIACYRPSLDGVSPESNGTAAEVSLGSHDLSAFEQIANRLKLDLPW